MARTPSNEPRWSNSKCPLQKLEPATPNSSGIGNTQDPSPSNPTPNTTTPPSARNSIPRDLYTSLEKYYKPLYAIICKHPFIQQSRYPVRQSARVQFVRDVYEEGGLLGFSDEVIRQVLVDVKRYFLEKVGRLDAFGEGVEFGAEVDDMGRLDVVEDGGDVVEGVSVNGEPVLETLVEVAVGSYSQGLVRQPVEHGVSSGGRTKPMKPEKKRKRKRKQTADAKSVEVSCETEMPLDNHEGKSVDPAKNQMNPVKHEKKRKQKRSRDEGSLEVSHETDTLLGM
ncbi:hypothetical protein BJX63DRAFT_349972 [Aspergillus granulosus]|uniref:Uncharacterized protein n=1 Tax=Aspergillus granulosus TaxID=176169 RepID=A0ABR4H2G8_9EURO